MIIITARMPPERLGRAVTRCNAIMHHQGHLSTKSHHGRARAFKRDTVMYGCALDHYRDGTPVIEGDRDMTRITSRMPLERLGRAVTRCNAIMHHQAISAPNRTVGALGALNAML
jgi:hypothetical protein